MIAVDASGPVSFKGGLAVLISESLSYVNKAA